MAKRDRQAGRHRQKDQKRGGEQRQNSGEGKERERERQRDRQAQTERPNERG